MEDVLESVKNFDEIVICDMHSTDSTIEICRKYNCKIVYHKHLPYVEPARNFAIQEANNEWVLVIDPDEVIPKDLKDYLYEIIKKPNLGGVYIPFKNYFIGSWMRSAYPDHKLRFFRKKGAFWPNEIHSTVKVEGDIIKIPKEKINLASDHLANDSISVILNKTNTYSDAEVHRKKSKKNSIISLIFSPLFWFIKYYFIKKGFLDGKKGFIFACLKAQYKFCSLAKTYEYNKITTKNNEINFSG